jgi:hypothetical protein
MADNRQHIDDLLRNGLGDYTQPPPAGAWADMESKLDDSSPVDHLFSEALSGYTEAPPAGAWADMEARLDDKRKRRRGFAWYWLAAGLVGLLIGGYCLLGDKNKNIAVKDNERVTDIISAPQPETIAPVVENTPAVEAPAPTASQTEPAPVEKAAVKNTLVQVPQRTAEPQLAQAPKQEQHTNTTQQPVAKNIQEPAPLQKTDLTNNIPDAPAQKQNDRIAVQDLPTAVPANTTADPVTDDIAAAMRNRKTPTVMNITQSRYADSMAEIAAKERVKQDTIAAVAKDTTPVVVSAPVKVEPVVPEANIAPSVPDTMSATVADLLNGTEKVLRSTADAILPASQQIQTPPDAVAFTGQEPVVAQTDNGTDKGSLAAFIGPMEDTATYITDVTVNTYTPDTTVAKTPLQADIVFKTGYERGFDATTISKFVLAPTINVKLSKKLGLIFQPAVKLGGVNNRQMNDARSYHSIVSSYVDSVNEFNTIPNAQTGVYVGYVREKYLYKQTHDSVVVSHKYDRRALVELDLPVMLSYKLLKNMSIYGGPVLSYSNIAMVNTQVNTYAGATLLDSAYSQYRKPTTKPTEKAPLIEDIFTYNTDNITTYNSAAYANTTANKFRMGYTLGASYFVNNNISVDISMQQNLSRLGYIPNAGVRNLYKQPYVRFMVGYKLYGNKK